MAGDRTKEIAALLIQAGQAHGKHEQADLNGVYDQEWPRWYAGFIVEQGISALLGHAVSVDQIADFFIANYAEFQKQPSGTSWADFTAAQMQALL